MGSFTRHERETINNKHLTRGGLKDRECIFRSLDKITHWSFIQDIFFDTRKFLYITLYFPFFKTGIFFFLQCTIKVPLDKGLNHQLLRVSSVANKQRLVVPGSSQLSCACRTVGMRNNSAPVTFHTRIEDRLDCRIIFSHKLPSTARSPVWEHCASD